MQNVYKVSLSCQTDDVLSSVFCFTDQVFSDFRTSFGTIIYLYIQYSHREIPIRLRSR